MRIRNKWDAPTRWWHNFSIFSILYCWLELPSMMVSQVDFCFTVFFSAEGVLQNRAKCATTVVNGFQEILHFHKGNWIMYTSFQRMHLFLRCQCTHSSQQNLFYGSKILQLVGGDWKLQAYKTKFVGLNNVLLPRFTGNVV